MQCSGDRLSISDKTSEGGHLVADIIGSASVLHGGVLVTSLNAGGGLGGRSYFGNGCSEDRNYLASDYLEFPLAGRQISWEVDLSGAGCGCNVAFYLVSMRNNPTRGTCGGEHPRCLRALPLLPHPRPRRFCWRRR